MTTDNYIYGKVKSMQSLGGISGQTLNLYRSDTNALLDQYTSDGNGEFVLNAGSYTGNILIKLANTSGWTQPIANGNEHSTVLGAGVLVVPDFWLGLDDVNVTGYVKCDGVGVEGVDISFYRQDNNLIIGKLTTASTGRYSGGIGAYGTFDLKCAYPAPGYDPDEFVRTVANLTSQVLDQINVQEQGGAFTKSAPPWPCSMACKDMDLTTVDLVTVAGSLNTPCVKMKIGSILQVELVLTATETLWFWLHGKAPNTGANSVKLFVNNVEVEDHWSFTSDDAWHWDRCAETIQLGAGTHTIEIRRREVDLVLDEFRIANSSQYWP